MLASDIISIFQGRIGDYNYQYMNSSDVLYALNEAQNEVLRETKLNRVNLTVAANALPKDLEASSNLVRVERVLYGTSPLNYTTVEDLDAKNIDVTTWKGRPYFYYIIDESLYCYPVPDASDTTTITIDIVATLVEITTTGDTVNVPVRYKFALVDYMLSKYYERIGQVEWYDRAISRYEKGIGKRIDESRVEDRNPVIRDDGFDLAYDYLM